MLLPRGGGSLHLEETVGHGEVDGFAIDKMTVEARDDLAQRLD